MQMVAIVMWVLALGLLLTAARRRDDTLKGGIGVAGGYLLMMMPRVVLALFLAGFVAELLPGAVISAWLGSSSGFRGIMIASVAGIAVPAGGVVAFPLALAMLKIGVGLPQLVAFLTAWEIFAVHRVLAFEIPFMGTRFVALRICSSFMLPPVAGMATGALMPLLGT
ncbi:MAG: hypothetical protein V3R85_06880 [Alphaproteobacteria bacterium]